MGSRQQAEGTIIKAYTADTRSCNECGGPAAATLREYNP
jgi:ribosomal protein L37E